MKREFRISLAAVFIGGLVDVISTNLLVNFLFAYVVIDKGFPVDKIAEIFPQISNIIHSSSILFAVQTVFELLGSILGGYVAARIAGEDEVPNAIAASIVMVAIGIFEIITGPVESIPLAGFGIVITPWFYRLGALVRVQQKTSSK